MKNLQDYVLKTLAVVLAIFALTACGEHGFEDWLFGESSSSEEEASVVSSSSGSGNGGDTPNPNAVVEPLIKTKWDQRDPYYDLYPVAGGNYSGEVFKGESYWARGSDGRFRTGCDNTAWSMIMKYHKHPVRGSGQSNLIKQHGITVPTVNLNVAYDWDNMLNEYTSANPGTEQQRNAVATLMYHVAAARGANDSDPITMTTNFGYDKSIQKHNRKYFTDAEWESLIKQQLDLRLPVLYGGGHAWIVDGYDNNGKFHMNWGWGGSSSDGWYSLNNLTPGTYDFNHNPDTNDPNYNHNIIYTNIMPDKGSTGSNEWALNSFAANKSSVSQNEPLTVSFRPSSAGFFIGGQFGVALVDNNGNIKAVIGTKNATERGAGSVSSNPIEISGFIPSTVASGQYKLRIVTKPEGGEWKIVTRADISENVPSAIPFTVTAGEANGGGYGMALAELAASETSVSRNGKFDISYRFWNVGLDVFEGQAGAALVDDNNNIVLVIRSWNISKFNVGSKNSNVVNVTCTVPNTAPIGQYKLRMVVKPTGSDEWRIATMSMDGAPTSINFEVK
jgi:hypothetical protein